MKGYKRVIALLMAASLLSSSVEPGRVRAEEQINNTVPDHLETESISKNSGQDLDDTKESNAEAKIGQTEYGTLQEAVTSATAGAEIEILKDLTITSEILVTKNLTFKAVQGQTVTIKRGKDYTGALFRVRNNAQVTFGQDLEETNLIVDGGAVWKRPKPDLEEVNAEEIQYVEAKSPVEEGAVNQGITANQALILMENGTIHVRKSATLQNNDNKHATEGGGAIRAASASVRIHVYGTIQNNSVAVGGGAINASGYTDFYDGAMIRGNKAQKNGGALTNYGGGIVTVHGGNFEDNQSLQDGGAIWTDGKVDFQNGTVSGNQAENGGAVYVNSQASNRNIVFYNGTMTGNKAKKGRDVYSAKPYITYRGAVKIGDVYLPEGQFLKISAALSGSIGVTYANDVDERVSIARGDGYTLQESDASHIIANQPVYMASFTQEEGIFLKYRPLTIESLPQEPIETQLNGKATIELKAAHVLEGVDIQYQWYKSDTPAQRGDEIPGATQASVKVDTDTAGIFYYRCVMTAEKAAQTETNAVTVKVVDKNTAEKPLITTHPADGVYDLQKSVTLQAGAEVKDGGTLSYQWYRADNEQLTDAEPIANANEPEYTVLVDQPGNTWYFCRVTNTNENVENKTNTSDSQAAKITGNPAVVRYEEKLYSSLDDALALIAATETQSSLTILEDVTLSRTTTLSDKTLIIEGKQKADGTYPVVKLTKVLTTEAFIVGAGGILTLKNVVLDGGAVWTGEQHAYLKRGTTNTGRGVNKPLITMSGGTVNLEEGAILQNQVSSGTAAGVAMTGGTLNINDGEIRDSFGGSHGGAVYAENAASRINMTGGKIQRVQARNSSAGICADRNTTIHILGGEIRNNYTAGRAGGLYVNGTLKVSGNPVFADNYAGGNGAGIFVLDGTATIGGGTFTGNIAGGDGGALAVINSGAKLYLNGGRMEHNSASRGNGVYVQYASVQGDLNLDGILDDIYTEKTLTLTFDGNGAQGQETSTVRFLGKYDLPEWTRNGYDFLGWFTRPEGGEQVQDQAWITNGANHTLYAHWRLNATNAITIQEQPVGGTFYKEDNATLKVTGSAEKGNVSYQWLQCDNENGDNPKELDGQTGAELSLPQELGIYYYRCKLTAENAVDAYSDVVRVVVISRNEAWTPVLEQNPLPREVFVGEDVLFLVKASTPDQGEITYQWYRNTTPTPGGEKEEMLAGQTGTQLQVKAMEAGTFYYYAKVTNTLEGSGQPEKTAATYSAVAQLTVHKRIKADDITADARPMSADYWARYRIGQDVSLDGYITSVTSQTGQYGQNAVNKAVDGNWSTFWESGQHSVSGAGLELSFDKNVKFDRILYATRQDGGNGKGYPTKLTISAKNENGVYEEVGVAESAVSRGYKIFTLPDTVTTNQMKFSFSAANEGWASAAEIVLLRAEDTVLTGSASITGTAAVGSTLQVIPNLTYGEKDQLSYQWQSSEDGITFADIQDADESTYTIKGEDRTRQLRVRIRDKSGAYTGEIYSDTYQGEFTVKLEGQVAIGETLKAALHYVDEDENITYQWEKSTNSGEGFTTISQATEQNYTVSTKDANEYIRVGATVKVNGKSCTVYSDPVEVSLQALMTGTPQVGGKLMASLGGLLDPDAKLAYEWQIAEGKEEGSVPGDADYTAIASADGGEYNVPAEYLGHHIRVKVTLQTADKDYEYTSTAWKIMPQGTYLDYTGDSIYLSDLRNQDMTEHHVGYGNLKIDKNPSGETIALLVDDAKKYFMKGIGAHATSWLVYDVSDYVTYYRYDRFLAYLGVDYGRGDMGNGVKFTVQTSKDGISWETAVQTDVLKGTSNAVYVDIPLDGVKYLKIYSDENGNNASDHSVIADAKLANAAYKEEDVASQMFKTVSQYDEELKALDETTYEGQTYAQRMEHEDYRKLAYQRHFVKKAGYELLAALLYQDEYVQTLDWFMNDMEALEMYIAGGEPAGTYTKFVDILSKLYMARAADMEDEEYGSLYKEMIIAIALTHSGKVGLWADWNQIPDPVERFDVFKRLHANGFLFNNIFENLEVEEMRWVMDNNIDNQDLEWLNYYIRYHTKFGHNQGEINATTLPGPYYFITYGYGYDYWKSDYYTAENKAMWQEKWKLTQEHALDDRFVINVPYDNKPKLWIVWEEGAVCGGISQTGANILAAFGVPTAVSGQPGHLAYLAYNLKEGADAENGNGVWSIGNDISGWTQSEKKERLPNGWGSNSWDSKYQSSYILLAQAALNTGVTYTNSQALVKLADVHTDDPQEKLNIYEEALGLLNINMDAWVGMIETYGDLDKTEQDYLALANRISEALTYYPLPMWDILENLIKPHVKTEEGLASLAVYKQIALKKASNAKEGDTLQPGPAKTMANYLLGEYDFSVATFSFDGENAGKIVLNEMYSGDNQILYSLDGGQKWAVSDVGKEVQLSAEEIESIDADKDILVRLQGQNLADYYTIDITKGRTPSELYANDRENQLKGDVENLLWREKGTKTWNKLTEKTVFTGYITIELKTSPTGTVQSGDIAEYQFYADTDTDTRKYIPLEHVNYEDCSSEETAQSGNAVNSLDGNINTLWHTSWNQNDSERYVIASFDEPLYLTSVDYTPRKEGNNGRFQACEVYTSMDGVNWTLAGSATGWALDAAKKTVNLFTPVYTKYVKVRGAKAYGNFGSAAMLEFFEDTTVEDKKVVKIDMQSEPIKKEYVVGEELDTTGLIVHAKYEDGSESILNTQLLDYSKTIFDKEGEETIRIQYRLDQEVKPLEFQVKVGANTKTASGIEIASAPEKTRYFVGDVLETEGLVVKAHYTDGTTGYLFPEQYEIDVQKFTEAGDSVAVTVAYTQDAQTFHAQFTVEVTKEVESIRVAQYPEKAQYNLGESFDPTGMKVELVFADGTISEIESADYRVLENEFSHTSGTKELTVEYARLPEKTTSLEVLVYPYLTADYLRLESEEGKTTAYVSSVEGTIPADGKVIVPQSVSVNDSLSFTVTAIHAEAFVDQKDIVSVELPKTVQKIESNAFKNCVGIKELYLTQYDEETIAGLAVADDAFGADEGEISGTIYTATQELADQLKDRQLKGLEKFTIRPITEKMTGIEITLPDKITYHLGEDFDDSGLVVKALLSGDGETGNKEWILSENLYTVDESEFDSSTAGEKTITIKANGTDMQKSFQVEVVPAKPRIIRQPQGMDYGQEETPAALSVEAEKEDAGTLTYQWYWSDNENGEDAKLIPGANGVQYQPEQETKTTRYYFAKVSNNDALAREETAVTVTSEIAKITVDDFEARIGRTGYETLQAAVDAAQDGEQIDLLKDLEIASTVEFMEEKTLTINGRSYTAKRTAALLDGVLLRVEKGCVKLENIVLDGGAVWSGGNHNDVLERDEGNQGIQARTPLVRVKLNGELKLGEGASLQNNDNAGAYGDSGGAFRLENNAKLIINGGQIVNNRAQYGGAALAANSSQILMEEGRVSGNHTISGGGSGAFCMDHTAALTVEPSAQADFVLIEDNVSNGSGGAIWLSNGTATLNGGTIRNNKAAKGGAVYVDANGTLTVGKATIQGNLKTGRGSGIDGGDGSGKIVFTDRPNMTDEIYLKNGKYIQVKGKMIPESEEMIKIPLTVATYQETGGKIAQAETMEQAQLAAEAFTVQGGELPVYSLGTEVYYGIGNKISITKDLPEEMTILTGTAIVLQTEAEITPADSGNLVYQWYRSSDENGSDPQEITDAQSPTLVFGDCNEGVYYFYCEVREEEGKADPVRTKVVKVTVQKFTPAKRAIEKFTWIQ